MTCKTQSGYHVKVLKSDLFLFQFVLISLILISLSLLLVLLSLSLSCKFETLAKSPPLLVSLYIASLACQWLVSLLSLRFKNSAHRLCDSRAKSTPSVSLSSHVSLTNSTFSLSILQNWVDVEKKLHCFRSSCSLSSWFSFVIWKFNCCSFYSYWILAFRYSWQRV